MSRTRHGLISVSSACAGEERSSSVRDAIQIVVLVMRGSFLGNRGSAARRCHDPARRVEGAPRNAELLRDDPGAELQTPEARPKRGVPVFVPGLGALPKEGTRGQRPGTFPVKRSVAISAGETNRFLGEGSRSYLALLARRRLASSPSAGEIRTGGLLPLATLPCYPRRRADSRLAFASLNAGLAGFYDGSAR